MACDSVNFGQYKITATAAALGYPSAGVDIKDYRTMGFIISGLTSETIALYISHDNGVSWSGKIRPYDLTTGALSGSSDLGNGSYQVPVLCGQALKMTKSATSESATVSINFRS